MFGLLAALVGLFGSSGPPPVSAQTETGICDRTERVQDAILGMLYGVDDCADVTGSHLAGITLGMRIRNGSYDRQALSLESGDFAGLVNIEGLAIYNHTMDALPEDIFDGLGSLESLDLSNNEITALPEGVFDGLGSLESLDLSNNEITALPEGVFDGLGSLESLDLSNNEIAALPEDVFDGLGRLDHLELWSNRINALPEDVFEGLGNLTYLRLSFNQLSALPDDVFDDLGNLAYLDVQGNQLGALPEDVFNGAGSLKRLDLSYNEIAALPEDVFEGLGNLTLLRLDSNRLASPPEDVFDGLDSLMHLYLSHNRIHTLPEDVFEGLGNLTYLYLHNNPGTPFTLTADLERQGDNAVLVKVAEAVPFDMAVTLSATGGTLSAASVTIKGGTAGSEAVTATRSGDGPLTVSVVWAVFQAGYYSGVRTGLGEPLILGDAAGGNRPATGTPAISGAVQVGETLTADTSGIADEDGLDNVSYSYQWLSSRDTETDGATGSTYTLQATDLGKIIKVRVTFTDDVGNEETLTSAATDTVEARPNSPATGAPTISGTAQVGETLTADTSGISDIDGLDNLTYSYQWLTSRDTQIAGAISSTYTLAEADAGKAIKVRVSFTDDAGNAEILTSAATAAVAARPNSAAAGEPTISGTAQVGQMLTASTSGVSDTDGLANATFTYQWISNDGSADSDISGATDATYTLVKADEGKTIKVRVSFTDDAGNQETLTSAATTEVAARPNSPATGAPAISGTAQVGETLTADTSGIADADGLSAASFSYQWLSSRDTEIQGATGAAYALASADEGKTIKVRVSFTDDRGHQETLTSAATGAVAAAPAPLTASIHDEPDSHDRQSVFNFELRFSENFGLSYKTLRDHAFTVTGGSVTGARRLDPPSNIRWEISVRPAGNGDVTVVLPVTTDCAAQGAICTGEGRPLSNRLELTVSKPNSAAAGAPTVNGTAQVGQTLSASTSGISDSDGLNNATFAYQWLSSRDTEISGETGSTYTLVDADEGEAIKVRVSFTDDRGHQETLTSTATAAVAARPNSAAAGAPTVSGTAQVGQTLSASTSGISDSDGLNNATFAYQWLSSRDTEISGETGSTYTLVDADEGEAIKVRVSFTDDRGHQETLTSTATAAVAARPNSAAAGAPTVSGTAQVGQTLSASTSGISDSDGLNNATFAYQWLSSRDTEISGETGSTYTLVDADEGEAIKVRVSFTDDRGHQETLTSTATAAVAARPNSAAAGAPTVNGTAQVGQPLTASASGITDSDGLNNATFAYQWLSSDSDISGETGSTYKLVGADEGKTIKVRVSFTDDRGHQETLTSAATGAVAAAPAPLTATIHYKPDSHDGQSVFNFELRFSENFGLSYKTLRDHAFTVTGGSVTGARRLDPPSNIGWAVVVEPGSNGDVTVVLPVTTDCAAQGAICTGDGRPLSNRLEITVSGPSG